MESIVPINHCLTIDIRVVLSNFSFGEIIPYLISSLSSNTDHPLITVAWSRAKILNFLPLLGMIIESQFL